MVQCDLAWLDHDHTPVAESPRQILKTQAARAKAMGLVGFAGTELEFNIYNESYETAGDKHFRGLTPANQYNVDYSLLGTARVEPLLRRIRNEMAAAGMTVENSKGECNLGQHEINFRYRDALGTADDHAIYKNGAKEIASQEGHAITFMAKFNEREGNSCHIHCSLAGEDGANAFAADQALFEHFVAGQLACMRELTLLYAPHVNSYKRFAKGSFAPTAIAWGRDNRTCSLRVENRLPGADVNPYLALSAMIAAGLHGIENELPLEGVFEGNAYESDKPRVPSNVYLARDAFAASEVAATAFGGEVVDHYLNRAGVEIEAFEAAVTDWERYRGFERL
jgi:glutamine synthetase